MRAATPGFVGERLTEAREARGLNGAQLADGIGITRQAVSQYEKGHRTPAAKILEAMAQWLRFPAHRFTRPMATSPKGLPFFRSLAAATKTARTRAARRINWVQDDICPYLREQVVFPEVNFPNVTAPSDPSELSFDKIEEIAGETRRFWGLGDGPIPDVVLLLENNGAVVVCQESGGLELDAFSRRDPADSTPYVVLNTDRSSAARLRFSAAHELGHILLHRNLRSGQVFHASTHRLLEDQANYFAGAFLMPEETFSAEVLSKSIQGFVTNKPRWRVSIAAMILRSRNLELITKADTERLFTYISQRGWRKREPYDDELEVERPRFIERAFDLILREGSATRASIESDLALTAPDIEKTIGLDEGFFDSDVEHLKFPRLHDNGTPAPPDEHTQAGFN